MKKLESLLAKKLRDYRIQNGVNGSQTQEDLAYLLDVSIDAVSKYERSLSFPRGDLEVRFVEKLGWSSHDMLELRTDWQRHHLRSQDSVNEGVITEESFSSSFDDDGRLQGLAKELFAVEDGEFPAPEVEGNDYGNDQRWISIFEQRADTGCQIKTKQGELAAHWFFVAVKDDVFEKGIRGENINASFGIDDTVDLIPPGKYNLYFVSLFVRKEHDNVAVWRHILGSIQDKLLEFAQYGVFFQKVFGNMSSPRMVNLAGGINFTEICDHKHHKMEDQDGNLVPTKVFGADVSPQNLPRIFGNNKRLIELYKQQLC